MHAGEGDGNRAPTIAVSTSQQFIGRTRGGDSDGRRVLRWLLRYGPAEVAGSLAAILTLVAADGATGSAATAAYAAVVAECLVYYGSTFLRDWMRPDCDGAGSHARTIGRPFRVARRLLQEFGAAEVLDLLVFRPLCLGVGLEVVGGAVGAFAGKMAADLAFYAQVLTMYERRRRLEAQ